MGSVGLLTLVINTITCMFAIVMAHHVGLNNPYGIVMTSCIILIGSMISAMFTWIWSVSKIATAKHRAKAPLYTEIQKLNKKLKEKDINSPAEEIEYKRMWE